MSTADEHSPEPDDRDLVKRVNAGDAHAFETLYRRHRDWVVGVAWRFTGDEAAALDIMQETFLQLLERFPPVSPPFVLTANLRTYLYAIVRNAAITRGRTRKRHADHHERFARMCSRDEAGESSVEIPDARDRRDALRDILAGLPEMQREILILRFVEGLALQEIANAVQIPLGTAKSRLHAALAALRDGPRTKSYFS